MVSSEVFFMNSEFASKLHINKLERLLLNCLISLAVLSVVAAVNNTTRNLAIFKVDMICFSLHVITYMFPIDFKS